MSIDAACQALRTGKVLELSYGGAMRSVEVHAVGYTRQGHSLMRVWQVRGAIDGRESVGWKLIRFDEGFTAEVSDERSAAPRRRYKRGDRAMARIVYEV
jgi:hypothetical protein